MISNKRPRFHKDVSYFVTNYSETPLDLLARSQVLCIPLMKIKQSIAHLVPGLKKLYLQTVIKEKIGKLVFVKRHWCHYPQFVVGLSLSRLSPANNQLRRTMLLMFSLRRKPTSLFISLKLPVSRWDKHMWCTKCKTFWFRRDIKNKLFACKHKISTYLVILRKTLRMKSAKAQERGLCIACA